MVASPPLEVGTAAASGPRRDAAGPVRRPAGEFSQHDFDEVRVRYEDETEELVHFFAALEVLALGRSDASATLSFDARSYQDALQPATGPHTTPAAAVRCL